MPSRGDRPDPTPAEPRERGIPPTQRPMAQTNQEPVKPAEDEPTFEQAMARLEEIVTELQRDDVALEKAFGLWEEGQKLHAHCTAILERLKKRLEETKDQRDEDPPGRP